MFFKLNNKQKKVKKAITKPNEIKKNVGLLNINSKYILKNIFSLISERIKLDIAIYNKTLQEKLELKIDDYKEFSGKIKKGERNGYGEEYDCDKNSLLFEGEYKDNKKNGKGKEYDNGDLIFEGEYLNGKKISGKGFDEYGKVILILEKNGKGKEYYDNGKIQFEGEYINGLRWKGKGYNYEGKEEFEIKNGNGFGKEFYSNGKIKYEGEYLNGRRNGKGKSYRDYLRLDKWDSYLEFEGEFFNGKKWNVKGAECDSWKHKLRFIGEYLNGKRNGIGKEYSQQTLVSEGEYLNGEKEMV